MAKQNAEMSPTVFSDRDFDTLQVETGQEACESSRETQGGAEVSLYPVHDSIRLMDSNLIFQPLLSALRVMPQELKFTTITDSSRYICIYHILLVIQISLA